MAQHALNNNLNIEVRRREGLATAWHKFGHRRQRLCWSLPVSAQVHILLPLLFDVLLNVIDVIPSIAYIYEKFSLPEEYIDEHHDRCNSLASTSWLERYIENPPLEQSEWGSRISHTIALHWRWQESAQVRHNGDLSVLHAIHRRPSTQSRLIWVGHTCAS